MKTIEIIYQIIREKEAKNKSPTYALLREVLNIAASYNYSRETVLKDLKDLIRDEKIEIGKTINDKYIAIK